MDNTKEGYNVCYIGNLNIFFNFKEYFCGILKNFLAKKDLSFFEIKDLYGLKYIDLLFEVVSSIINDS